ncbi:Reversion-inducing cysteine-rich protein with Kazal motif, partial [Dissostichus eleginoides]
MHFRISLATIKSESRLKHLLQRLPSYCPEPMASSKNDITKVCRKDTEAIFRTDSTPTVSQISAVTEYCQSHSPQLIGCVGNFTKSYPIRSPIDTEAPHCQVACGRILRSLSTEHEIMEALITDCGSQPLPQDPMWQCFLGSAQPPPPSEEEPPRHPSKMDCAKLHCCSKANTSLCRDVDMCERISTNWGSQTWQDFDQLCEYNPVEKPLITCLSDVREPCQLGCKHLSYCSNFNNRPTELFRSCNVQSDQGAMNDMKLWSNGTIKMPFMNIPVLDIRKCLPDMWKAVACSLQIKPCLSKARGSLICKADCVEILTQCGDRKRFYEGQTPERICDLLSPTEDPERCIPLYKYLSDLNKHMRVHSGERPYKCVYCNKAFTASSILRTHIRQHSGERPFKCAHCGKAFASHAAHDSHVRRTHAKDPPPPCDLCGANFKEDKERKLHMKNHL